MQKFNNGISTTAASECIAPGWPVSPINFSAVKNPPLVGYVAMPKKDISVPQALQR